MAKPATTHVIELESGIGEPAFIPLTLGQELQPLSVGKKGMWRIEGARVLDVHAFVYFDGSSLFLQSADEQSAALVDGYRVGKAWTQLHAPCNIEIGAARLKFRSLVAEAQAQAQGARRADDQQATVAMGRAPVESPPDTQRVDPAFRETQRSQEAPAPMSFPKQDRPFAPGAFVTRNDDESTRIAPLESTGARAALGLSGALRAVAPPRPAAGRPVEEDLSTRAETARSGQNAGGTGPYAAAPGGQPQPLGFPPGMVQGVMPIGSMPPGAMNAMPPGGYPQQGQPPQGYPQEYPPQGYPPQEYPPQGYPQMMGGSAAYGTMPGPGMGQGPPGMGQGSYGPQGGPPQPPEGSKTFADIMKNPSQRKKLLALAVILLGGAYVLLMDDDSDAPARRPTAADAGIDGAPRKADAAAMASGAASAGSASAVPPASAPPPASPCPPGFQPYGAVETGQPITCVPTQPEAPASATAPTPDAHRPKATGQKTLERQAIDYVAVGEYGKAIGIYEKLSEQSPDNKVYSEALRILRAKVDAGAQ